MDFQETYLKALLEHQPDLYRSLTQSGELRVHMEHKTKEAYALRDRLLANEPRSADGAVADRMAVIMAEERVLHQMLEPLMPREDRQTRESRRQWEAFESGAREVVVQDDEDLLSGDFADAGEYPEDLSEDEDEELTEEDAWAIHLAWEQGQSNETSEKVSAPKADRRVAGTSPAIDEIGQAGAGGAAPVLAFPLVIWIALTASSWFLGVQMILLFVRGYDLMANVATGVILFDIFVFLPMTLARPIRHIARGALRWSALLFAALVWGSAWMECYGAWGRPGATVGTALLTFGVVPLAVLGDLLSGRLWALSELAILVAAWAGATYGGRRREGLGDTERLALATTSSPVRPPTAAPESAGRGPRLSPVLFGLWWIACVATPVGAWITHIVWSIDHNRWGMLIAGGIVVPIGIIHGLGLWFGWFH
ncbi:MAG: hypothetical protein JO127_17065 [Caulobacteraceae bacterium]|nr:hypothetical protein [Caulobacteraceae bacterium]